MFALSHHLPHVCLQGYYARCCQAAGGSKQVPCYVASLRLQAKSAFMGVLDMAKSAFLAAA
jgi:hypothetical protein